jgi:hypothetical protein
MYNENGGTLGSAAARREKLVSIHKREMLKGLLINKFRSKYDMDKMPNLDQYINNEINKFLSCDRLTSENLKKLDFKIAKEIETRDKKETILEVRKTRNAGNDIL